MRSCADGGSAGRHGDRRGDRRGRHALSSCGLGNCGDFALSLVSDTGGQSSPVAAATWFAVHGGVPGVPRSGWHETGRDDTGATVRTGGATLHAAQGPDGTWQIDSGSC